LASAAPMIPLAENTEGARGFFAWLDKTLDRI
jgi:sulfite dehydrogenase (quinone) subunit SoeB